MIHGYPYTDFHELNLDYILNLCRSSMGLHLEQADKFLKLVNAQGDEISKIQIYYAQTALQDDLGNNIDAYIIRGAVNGDNLIFTKGNGEVTTLTVPYSVKAEKDIRNNDILSYIKNISVTGTNIIVTNGNNDSYSITVPYAVQAKEDINGKDIVTYVADITIANDKLVVKDSTGAVIREITVPYAIKAKEDINGEDIAATYGALITSDVTTISLRSKDNTILSTITVPYSVKALSDTQGNEFLSDYGYNLAVAGNKIALESHDGSTLNEITVPFSVLSTDATNAIESVQISGDELVFTTYGGVATRVTVPYSVKALKDNLNNTLSTTYIANAVNDPNTGKITFYAQDGSIIAEMIPTVDSAVHDAVGNVIADYVKTIIVDNQSNYVTVTHGTGVTDTLVINYANKAWKDTYDNVIGNTYIRRLECIPDVTTGHYVIVAYNGELSELFRFDVKATSAQTDINGKNITSYVSDVIINPNDDGIIDILDGNANIINSLVLSDIYMRKHDPTGDGYISINRKANTTIGTKSVSIGNNNTASGNNSVSLGNNNTASGNSATASGYSSTASGDYSSSFGYGCQSTGYASYSEGYGSKATNQYCHAEGQNSTASGFSSHAEGTGTKASSDCTHAEGQNTEATAQWAHSEGFVTKAQGQGSHSEGKNTIASGECSHAEGSSCTASGNNSHVEGNHTTANCRSQHVFGEYNVLDNNTASSRGSYIEIVGNGSGSSNLANARTLDWQGNETIAGTLTQQSDGRYKDIINDTIPDLSTIKAVMFKWKDNLHDDKLHIGYIAQNVEEIAPYLVVDSNDIKSLDYIAVLVAKVAYLEAEIKKLKG